MTLMQIINAVIVYSWLFAVLFFLWRHAIGGNAHVKRLQMMLNDNARKSADAAMIAAEAAQKSAEAVSQLADLLRKRNA